MLCKRGLLLWLSVLAVAAQPILGAAGNGRVACVGDSITAGAGIKDPATNSYPAQLGKLLGEGWDVRNFGRSSTTLLTNGNFPYIRTPQYKAALEFKPDVVVIKLGTNDTKPVNWEKRQGFVSDYVALIGSFRVLESKPEVWICYPVPVYPERWGINDTDVKEGVIPLVDEVARQTGAKVIDLYSALSGKPEMFPDKVHPNAAGAGVMAKEIAAHLTGKKPGKQPATYVPKYTDAFDMRYGLFIHWVACGPGARYDSMLKYPDGSSIRGTNVNDWANAIDVEKVADEIETLGFEYAVVTDFHGFGTMLHPSAVSDRWRGKGFASDRDVIGELIAALKKRGIGFILFTHPVCGHRYQDAKELGWHDDPKTGYKKWNDFINEIYAELAERYGNDMMGMGFDGTFGIIPNGPAAGKLDLARLRKTILSKAPNLQLYGLAGPNEVTEFKHKEIWRPSWHDPWMSREEDDWDSENWPAYRIVTSVVQPDHWATIGPASNGVAHLNADQLYRYTVLQAAVATEGPGMAWAASPYGDGSWEKGIREVFAEVEQTMRPIRESLTRVYPSTSYPRQELSMLSTLPYGIAATKSTDDRIEYIHVLNPPDGKTLNLPMPADGKRFTSAMLLATGRPVELRTNVGRERFPASAEAGKRSRPTEEGLQLVLGDDAAWDELNTVIALEVAPETVPRKNLALHKKVESNMTRLSPLWPPNRPFGRIRLVDGIRSVMDKPAEWSTANLGWSSEPQEKQGRPWVRVDLGDVCKVSEVRLYPRDDEGDVGYGFPIAYRLEISEDAENWKTVATVSDLHEVEGVQIHQFETVQTRYVRLTGTELQRRLDDERYIMQLTDLAVYETATPKPLEPKITIFKTVDEDELIMKIRHPQDWEPGGEKLPALVLYHGGGWAGGNLDHLWRQAHFLSQRGIVTITPQYRTRQSHNVAPNICLEDAKSAMRYVRTHADELGIDATRIAAGGGSAGGQLATALAFIEGFNDPGDDLSVSCKPTALLLLNPVNDLGPDALWGHDRVKEFWEAFSPLHNMTTNPPPTLYMTGDSDQLVSMESINRYKAKMDRLGGRCDMKIYPGAMHAFFNSGDAFTQTLQQMDDFLVDLGYLPAKGE